MPFLEIRFLGHFPYKAKFFGYRALMEYKEAAKGHYVERFKLLLDPESKVLVSLPDGLSLKQVLKDYLGYMKEEFLKQSENIAGIFKSDIKWYV